MKSMLDLKLGHIRSKTWSPGKILEKTCVQFTRNMFNAIPMKLCQNVYLSKSMPGPKLGHVRSKIGHKVES